MDYISSTVLMLLTIIVLGALLITILTRLSEINKTLTIMRLELSTLKNSLANKVHSTDEKPEEAVQKKSEQKTTIQPGSNTETQTSTTKATDAETETKETVVIGESIQQPPMVDVPVKTPETEALMLSEEALEKQETAPTPFQPSVIAPTEASVAPTDNNAISLQQPSTKAEETPLSPTDEAIANTEQPKEMTEKTTNYEKFIGENLFGKIGILVFILGIGYFVKYAIDQNWINEVARTVMGFAVGVVMLGLAQWLHKRYHTFSSLLAGGAFGVFYLTVSIAFHYYQLFSQTAAFVILCLTTIFMAIVSIRYDRCELAVTALVGGFIAPFIVSTDSGSIIALQTYLTILNLGMFALAFYKKWGLLPIVAFAFTYIILWLTVIESHILYYNLQINFLVLGFATLFYFIFLLPVRLIMQPSCSQRMHKALMAVITLNGFIYLLYGGCVIADSDMFINEPGYLSFFIAFVNLIFYLYLRFRISGHDTLRKTMSALTIAFASIGVPLLFTNTTIFIIWATESVLLLWLYTKEKSVIYERSAAILAFLSIIFSLTYYILWYTSYEDTSHKLFLNSNFLMLFTISIASFAAAIIMQRNRRLFSKGRHILHYTPCNVIAYAVGFLWLYMAFSNDFTCYLAEDIAHEANPLTIATILLAGSLVLHRRFKVRKYKVAYLILLCFVTIVYMVTIWGGYDIRSTTVLTLQWVTTSVVATLIGYIMWKMLALHWETKKLQPFFAVISTLVWLTGARLVLLTFGNPSFDTGFSLSLGTAAFLLMIVGMRCKSKEVRMVSLAEFGIVLGKLVLSDVWTMPALGKIIVFISLGLLLLTLSFLYQKLKDVLF